MKQKEALKILTESFQADELVEAVFVKGSMGRGEHDEHSDIDLYCLVKEGQVELFLPKRLEHLNSYRDILFYEDYFIIAPQIIAVFDNLLHVDLYTVTEKSLKKTDFFQVLYDPRGIMDKYKATQDLRLSREEFSGHAYDIAWYLFQYNKAFNRGNDIWAVEMLHLVMINLAKVLLHHYYPNRAQLGIKALETRLPEGNLLEFKAILKHVTPDKHRCAVSLLVQEF
jgi:predicted nucleotidyltransferase